MLDKITDRIMYILIGSLAGITAYYYWIEYLINLKIK